MDSSRPYNCYKSITPSETSEGEKSLDLGRFSRPSPSWSFDEAICRAPVAFRKVYQLKYLVDFQWKVHNPKKFIS